MLPLDSPPSFTCILCGSAPEGLRHFGKAQASVEEVQAYLEETYCGHLSVETGQLSSLEERQWFADHFEELKRKSFSPEERKHLAKLMLESQVRPRRRANVTSTCWFFNLISFLLQHVGVRPLSGHKVCYCEALRRRGSREHDGIFLRAVPPVGPHRRHGHRHWDASQGATQPPDRPAAVSTRG